MALTQSTFPKVFIKAFKRFQINVAFKIAEKLLFASELSPIICII